MIHREISASEEGRKLARYLEKLLPAAPKSFMYTALRKNKIKVNRKKPGSPNLILHTGDQSDRDLSPQQETDFGYLSDEDTGNSHHSPDSVLSDPVFTLPVLYEDPHILVINKPFGLLSQKSRPEDISASEIARDILRKNGTVFDATFAPSVVHRLDRNTGGVMIMAKTLPASQILSEMIRSHSLRKFYTARVKGCPRQWTEETLLADLYRKNTKENKAEISPYERTMDKGGFLKDPSVPEGWSLCALKVKLVQDLGESSLLEVELLTGKSHQIRAQLAYHGYPILGDGKYNASENTYRQQLFASRVEFLGCTGCLSYLEGKIIQAPVPFL